MGDQRNLLLAIVASLVILLGFQFLFPTEETNLKKQKTELSDTITPSAEPIKEIPKSREDIIQKSDRITIKNDLIEGSISLTGARIEDIILKNYLENIEKNSAQIKLFSPKICNSFLNNIL